MSEGRRAARNDALGELAELVAGRSATVELSPPPVYGAWRCRIVTTGNDAEVGELVEVAGFGDTLAAAIVAAIDRHRAVPEWDWWTGRRRR